MGFKDRNWLVILLIILIFVVIAHIYFGPQKQLFYNDHIKITASSMEQATEQNTSSKTYPPIYTNYPTPTEKLWARVTNSIFARRSAHYDNRKTVYTNPVVIALILRDEAIDTGPVPDIYAKIVYSNGAEECLVQKAKWKVFGIARNQRKRSHFYNGYSLTFSLSTKKRPEVVFLSLKEDCFSHSPYLSIFWRKPKTKLDFAVCLHQPLFRFSDHEHMAAWIEANRALGAQKITIYYQEENAIVNEVVQSYAKEGFVEVLSWFQNMTSEDDMNFGQPLMIMDCLYRNMYSTKYLAFHDLDELLVPHLSQNWHGFVKHMDRAKRSCFKFCMSYFHDEHEVMNIDYLRHNQSICKNVTDIPVMFKRTKRTANVDCGFVRWKSICKPTALHYMMIHGTVVAPGYFKASVVPPMLGTIHHYRKRDIEKGEESIDDLSMMKHMGTVMKSLFQRFC